MRLAWEGLPERDRSKLVAAAVIFGERFESRVPEGSEPSREEDVQRVLMAIMNDVVEGLSESGGMSREEATAFLSDVAVRDKVFEMDEVICAYESGDESGESSKSLDGLLREAIEGRREKAVWADHWSSG